MKDVLVNISHTAAAKVLLMAVQLATTTILARTLSAEDYGVVGFANVIMALLMRINSLGLNQAVVRAPELSAATLDTAASLNLMLSVSAFFLAQLIAPAAGWLLDSPASVPVVRVLAFGFLLAPLGFLPAALLTREMRFAAQRTPSVVGALVHGLVAVGMALIGWKYWSLVWGSLTGAVANNGLLRLLRPVTFRWRIDRHEARKLLAFGLPISLAGLVSFVVLNADNFFIGAKLGPVMLGYYTVAFSWTTFGTTALQEIVHSVLFPKFSQLQQDQARMRAAYLRTLKVVLFFAALVNIGLFVVADGFLYHVLGKGSSRWLPASVALHVLCLYGVIRSAVETVSNPIIALGETRLILKSTVFAAGVEVVFLPLVIANWGLKGVAVFVSVVYASQCAFYLPFLTKRLGLGVAQIVETLLPALAASLISAGLAFALDFGSQLAWPVIFARLLIFGLAFCTLHEYLSRGVMITEIRNGLAAMSRKSPS